MSNKRITDLTELTTPTTDDVFPVVDIATNTTTKVQLGNLPVPSSVTTALATKQNTLVSGTNIKTVNSNSLLGSGDIAVQETLVSGTNIKTLNNTSLLGSGNITLTANPSGVSGAIQFSNGSAFASDAANLFWDDTNNRLGVGTNAPSSYLQVSATWNSGNNKWLKLTEIGTGNTFGIVPAQVCLSVSGYTFTVNDTNEIVGRIGQTLFGTNLTGGEMTARVGIRGNGSTSATTSLLVQNSAGASSLQVTDDGSVFNYGKSAIVDNTAFGRLALNSNTTGSQNAAYGFEALKANTTGSINAAFGDKALLNNGTGQRNSAFGARSLYTNQSGTSNSAFGNQALLNNTLGNQNCGMGLNALLGNETGNDNSAYGVSALSSNTTGSDNSALGVSTQSGNFSGSVILGKGATATASNQFVVGSSTTNAGSVASTTDVPATFLWSVRINGTNYKILMTT